MKCSSSEGPNLTFVLWHRSLTSQPPILLHKCPQSCPPPTLFLHQCLLHRAPPPHVFSHLYITYPPYSISQSHSNIGVLCPPFTRMFSALFIIHTPFTSTFWASFTSHPLPLLRNCHQHPSHHPPLIMCSYNPFGFCSFLFYCIQIGTIQ